MKALPKVTVLLCVFNGEPYLTSSIHSILNQTFSDFELLIINDGSTDGTLNIIQSFNDTRIRLINNNKNQGLISCLNQGIEAAQGVFLARHDSDDLAINDRLEKQVHYLDSNSKAVLVGTWLSLIDKNGFELEQWKYPEHPHLVRWAMLFDSPVGHSSVMFRTEVARELGGYSENHKYAEDFEFWSRMSKTGEIVNIPQILQQYRIHSESVSSQKNEAQEKMRIMISTANIKEYVHEELGNEVVDFLTNRYIKTDGTMMLKVISGYQKLLDRFAETNRINDFEKNAIERDIVLRIGNKLQQIGIGDRIGTLVKRMDFFSADFWLTGKFISFIVNEQFKSRIKNFVGKPLQATRKTHLANRA